MRKSLKDCLAALSAQTIKDFEVILVDDRSNDGTRALIETHGDPRIRYFRNEQPLGYGGTRNLSLKKAYRDVINSKEEQIQRLAADNREWRNFFFKKQGLTDDQIK